MKTNRVASFLLFLYIQMSFITLPAPVSTYGTELVGVAFAVLLMILYKSKIHLNSVFYAFVSTTFLVGVTYLQSFYLQYSEILFLNAIRTAFWISMALLLYPYIKVMNRDSMAQVIKYVVLLNASTIFLQLLSYYMTGAVIDFSLLLGGEPSRNISSGLFRPTGLTAEPAIFSGALFGCIIVYYLIKQKIDFVVMLGLLSMVLTFSTLATLLVIAFLGTVSILSFKRVLFFLPISICTISVLMPSILKRMALFESGDDASNNIKLTVLKNWLDESTIYSFGYGLVGKSNSAPAYYDALYDMTIIGNTFVIFGIFLGGVLLFLFFLWLFKLSFGWIEKVLILMVFMKLSSPNILFFSAFVLMVCAVSYQNRYVNKNINKNLVNAISSNSDL